MRSDLPAARAAAWFLLPALAAVPAAAVPCDDHSAYHIPVRLSAAVGSAEAMQARAGLLYVAAGDDGLRILQSTGPGTFAEVGSAATTAAARDVAAKGGYAYVTMPHRLEIFDVGNPASPAFAAAVDFPGAGSVEDVCVDGNRAYVVTRGDGVQIVDVTDPTAPAVLSVFDGRLLYPTTAVAAQGDRMVVGVGPDRILSVDVSDPVHPVETAQYDANAGEVKRLRFDDGWLVAIGTNVQLLDVGVPGALSAVAVIGTSGAPGDAALLGHRLFATQAMGPSVRVMDVATPSAPVELGWIPVAADGPVVVEGGYVVAWTPGGIAAVATADVVFAPHLVPPLVPPLSGDGSNVRLQGESMYVSSGRVYVYDVTEPELPELISAPIGYGGITLGFGTDGTHLVANERNDWDGHWFMTSWDISNPASPYPMGGLDGQATAAAVKDANAVIVRDGVLEVRATYGLRDLVTVPTQVSPHGLLMRGDLLYVAGDGLEIFDVADVRSPVSLGYLAIPTVATSVRVDGSRAYLTGQWQPLHVVDVTDPGAPVLLGSVDVGGQAWGFDVSDGIVYAPTAALGVDILDLRDPAFPVQRGDMYAERPVPVRRVAVGNGVVYLGSTAGISFLAPQCAASLTTGPPGVAVAPTLSIAPNPFREGTTLSFVLPTSGWYRLDVYDVSGRHVRRLVQAAAAAGTRTAVWDGRGRDGAPLPGGVYLVRMERRNGTETRKAVLLH